MGIYIPGTEREQKQMLEEIGFQTMEELYAHVPDEVKLQRELGIPEGMPELSVRRKMTEMARKNHVFPTVFRGAGAYRHYIPATVKSVLSKENMMTAYTPYQAEISQGLLQATFEFQTMICELTGMDVANASVYDVGCAAAEAVAMCRERKRKTALISATVDPFVVEAVRTYCFGNGIELTQIPAKDGRTDREALQALLAEDTACVLIQHPNFYGNLEEAKEIGEAVHEAGAKYIMSVNPISLGILKTPGEYGADIAVGEGQSLGLPLGFGGPYCGFMACVSALTRRLPGRIVGQTTDHNGKIGYVLTLQAREQHIRREKASSNICSNHALCALGVGVYLASVGSKGLEKVASLCTSKAHYMAEELEKAGLTIENGGEFFHEFVTTSEKSSEEILQALEEQDILGGYPLDGHRILWCCTEVNTKEEIDRAAAIVKEV